MKDELARELEVVLHGTLGPNQTFDSAAGVFIGRHGKALLAALRQPGPSPKAEEIRAMVEALRKKSLELLEHRHATAGWLMQDAATLLESLIPAEPSGDVVERVAKVIGQKLYGWGLEAEVTDFLRDIAFAAIAALPTHQEGYAKALGDWQPIETAPYSTPVEVKVGAMTFLARLEPGASMSDMETACDQWQAVNEGEHPPCWSGGACWASNEDGAASLQPSAWRAIRSLGGAS